MIYIEGEEGPLNYLLVLDFKANCVSEGEQRLKVQEIIEFPVVIISIKEKKIVDVFHHYVKPQVIPKLTEFCTEFTGITQEMVDKGMPLADTLKEFDEFLTKKIPIGESVVVTCGDWDIKTCIKKEAQFKKIDLPRYLTRWINLKKIFTTEEKPQEEIKSISSQHPVVSSMKEMLTKMGIPLIGQ